MAFENFPYTDFHNLNLDWVLETTKNLNNSWKDYYNVWNEWKNEVENFISDLDYEKAIDDYMNGLKDSGQLSDIVNSWLGNDFGVICIGDSYGQGYVPDGTQHVTSWIDLFKSKYFAGQQVYSSADGGAGFASTGQSGYKFQGLLTNLAKTIPVDKRKHVKYVVVAGGWNDLFFDVNDINSGISEFYNVAKEMFPNATCCIGFVAVPSNTALNTNERFEGWKNAKTSYETTWLPYKVLANANIGLRWNGVVSSDGVHPNATGQASLADTLYKSIIGTVSANRTSDIFYFSSTLGTWSYNRERVYFNNNIARIEFGNPDNKLAGLTLSSPINITNATFDLGAHDINFIPETSSTTCVALIHDSTGYHTVQAIVYFNYDDGSAHRCNIIRCKIVNTTSSGFVTYTNVDSIQFYGLAFDVALY